MNDFTRIEDLPPPTTQTSMQSANPNANYSTMNVYPNPYGIEPGIGLPPPSFSSEPRTKLNQSDMQHLIEQQQQQRLPSRDVPLDTEAYTHDEQIQPDYIPNKSSNKMKKNVDFCLEADDDDEDEIRYYEKKSRDKKQLEFFEKIQEPLILTMIYFFFQMEMVQVFMVRYFQSLGIFKIDGNLNFHGILLKSLLFGSCVFFLQQTVKYGT